MHLLKWISIELEFDEVRRNDILGDWKIQGDFYKKLNCPTLAQILKVFYFPDLAL